MFEQTKEKGEIPEERTIPMGGLKANRRSFETAKEEVREWR
jgi:hypothetical protein